MENGTKVVVYTVEGIVVGITHGGETLVSLNDGRLVAITVSHCGNFVETVRDI